MNEMIKDESDRDKQKQIKRTKSKLHFIVRSHRGSEFYSLWSAVGIPSSIKHRINHGNKNHK